MNSYSDRFLYTALAIPLASNPNLENNSSVVPCSITSSGKPRLSISALAPISVLYSFIAFPKPPIFEPSSTVINRE